MNRYLHRSTMVLLNGITFDAEALWSGAEGGGVRNFGRIVTRALNALVELESRGLPRETIDRILAFLAAAEDAGASLLIPDDEEWRALRRRVLSPEHPNYPK